MEELSLLFKAGLHRCHHIGWGEYLEFLLVDTLEWAHPWNIEVQSLTELPLDEVGEHCIEEDATAGAGAGTGGLASELVGRQQHGRNFILLMGVLPLFFMLNYFLKTVGVSQRDCANLMMRRVI